MKPIRRFKTFMDFDKFKEHHGMEAFVDERGMLLIRIGTAYVNEYTGGVFGQPLVLISAEMVLSYGQHKYNYFLVDRMPENFDEILGLVKEYGNKNETFIEMSI